ncbi:transmembrane protein [Microvirga flocculans]|uniref:Transmembrane protein n=1 Tax=Microvirga flocculans TaxID=217168 RepID=A0A7W6N8A9_9HYPH|nr:DoxX family protein [Microvirga flocculans]MBB4040260.1 transmembrane protein [Microvirga flocculans]
MTPRWINAILSSRVTEVAARILFTFPFWGSGLAKLLDFSGGMAEMRQFGLEPAWFYNSLTLFVQLVGSGLIISRRWTWLGAGALGVFTFLTIPIVHAFWRLEGERAIAAFHTAGEHMGMIGALVLVSILALRPKPAGLEGRAQNLDASAAGMLQR